MADKNDQAVLLETVELGIERRRGVFVIGWMAFVVAAVTALGTYSDPGLGSAFVVLGGFGIAFVSLLILLNSGSALATERVDTLMRDLSRACDSRNRVALEDLLQKARNWRLSAQDHLPLQRAEAMYAALIEQEAKAAATGPPVV